MDHRWRVICAAFAACAAAGAAQAQSPKATHILRCDIPQPTPLGGVPSAQPSSRIFRLAPGSFQEWDAGPRAFGPNLCHAFACTADAQRSEGQITTASLAFKVGIDHTTGRPYWRAVGASNLARTEGSCDLVAPPK